jgi:hypothetical protein
VEFNATRDALANGRSITYLISSSISNCNNPYKRILTAKFMAGKKVYLVCPVRKLTPETKTRLDDYVKLLEDHGVKVHYPPRDVNQDDSTGLRIMRAHREAMERSDEVHVFWSPNSEGSVCDLGMALMAEKPIRLVNKEFVEEWLKNNPGKSYTRVVYELDKNTRELDEL